MKVSMTVTVVMTLLWTFLDGISLSECPDRCHCNGKQTRCENNIPKLVPKYVREVAVILNNSTQLSQEIFCNISWNNVTNLSIDYSGQKPFYLGNYTFMGLHQVQVLKLHTSNRFEAYSNSLYGLENVKVLDLSGCSRLNNQDLITLLSIKNNTANLKKLILQNTGRIHEGIEFSQALVDTLASTNITEIDLSYTPVFFSNPNMGGICDTLKTLNLSNSEMDFRSHLDLYQPCKSLRNLDLNAVRVPHSKLYQSWSCINYHYKVTTDAGQFIKNLDKLNLSRLFSFDKALYFINCSLTGLGKSYMDNLKEFQFSGYNIPSLDMVIENIFDQLQAVELSDNKIKTIGPNIFKRFKHLLKIDLSKNKLSQNKLFDETFSVLFQNNSKLQEINLSHNGLRYLPSIVFTSNKYLKRIDISNNAIRQITFNVSRLIMLDVLDMRNNSIKHLDELSRGALDSLYEKQQRRKTHVKQKTTSTFLIDLRENPFSCECDSLQFIKWFAMSPIFTATRHLYHCKLNERQIEMNDKAVAAAADDCERPKRKLRKILLSSFISTTVTALLILLIIYMVKRYRRRKKFQRLDDQILLLHDDECGFRFPVFLSFSSDDSAFVIPNVLKPLKSHLQAITGTKRELVCVGDRHFRLGRSIFSEIITCLQDCAVVVVVMSRNYCRSDYCKLEIEQSRLMRKPIIIIVKEEVDEEDMNTVTKEVFRHFTRIGFIFEAGQIRLQREWEDVCLSIIQLV